MNKKFLWERIPNNISDLPKETVALKLESIPGKKRIFTPGRQCSPLEVSKLSTEIVAYIIKALIEYGWDIKPEKTVGISLLTEGAGVPFFEAFNKVWPGKKVGGKLNVWARRKLNGKGPKGTYAEFDARVLEADSAMKKHPIKGAVGIIYDIGATGSTLEASVPEIAPWFSRLIFGSPCTTLVAAKKFVDIAIKSGIDPKNLAVVPSEGFFGLDQNGTFLSHQLAKTITSNGNTKLSKLTYPHKRFCHIGAGGLAANWENLYEEELDEDEKNFGKTTKFKTIEDTMKNANLKWPDDFSGIESL